MSSFLFTDLSTATVTASSNNSDFPVSNLLNYDNQSRWIAATGSNDMWVQLSLGSALAVNRIIIDRHNFDVVMVSGSIKLRCADNAAFTTNVTTITTFATSSSDVLVTDLTSTYTKQYWRIYYSGVAQSPPYIGNIFLGTPVRIPFAYSWGYKNDNKEYATSEKVTLSGRIASSQPYEGRQVYELNCKMLTDTVKDSFVTLVESVRGRLLPFYFTDHVSTTRYVKFAEDYTPATVQGWNINELQSLKIRGYDVTLTSTELSTVNMFDIYDDEWIITVS